MLYLFAQLRQLYWPSNRNSKANTTVWQNNRQCSGTFFSDLRFVLLQLQLQRRLRPCCRRPAELRGAVGGRGGVPAGCLPEEGEGREGKSNWTCPILHLYVVIVPCPRILETDGMTFPLSIQGLYRASLTIQALYKSLSFSLGQGSTISVARKPLRCSSYTRYGI